MPIQLNLLERFAFFTLNAAPTPLLDLAGALGYQALSTAVRLDLFADGRIFSQNEMKQMLGAAHFSNIQFFTSPKWAGQSLVTAVK